MLVENEMHADAQPLQFMRERDCRCKSIARSHDGCAGKNSSLKCLRDALVNGFTSTEVVGIDD